MSQSISHLSSIDTDPLLLSSHRQQPLSRGNMEDLFDSSESDQPIFTSNNSEVLDLKFSFENTSAAQINTTAALANSTPDFLQYNFGDAFPACPISKAILPHSYSHDIQHSSRVLGNPHTTPCSHRVPYVRSHTNTPPYLQPAQPSVRRRSLSQGDADRIAASNTISNPTFVRLQAPRARSTTPEEKRRSGPYAQHSRSASQGPSPRGRAPKSPGTPKGLQGRPFSGGILSMPIGTPLNDVMEVDASGYAEHASKTSHYGRKDFHFFGRCATENGPAIWPIDHPEGISKSRQIIQIGAMAMQSSPGPDPTLSTEPYSTHHERILKKLEDIEQHLSLENGYSSDALRGCKMIREALAKKTEMDLMLRDAEEVQYDALDAPSKVYSEMGCDFYDGSNEDNEQWKLLIQENEQVEPTGDEK